MRGSVRNRATESRRRGEKQAQAAKTSRKVQTVRDANEAGFVPAGWQVDPLLCDGMLWLQRLWRRVSLRPAVYMLGLQHLQLCAAYPCRRAMPDVWRT